MKIEHIGLLVSDAHGMARWYEEHLGFVNRRTGTDSVGGVDFISDPDQEAMLELFSNSELRMTDWTTLPPTQVHIALCSEDPEADSLRLQAAGATFIERAVRKGPGDELLLLRDPWGVVLQLAKRGTKF
jgi:glyoxylase I family protein